MRLRLFVLLYAVVCDGEAAAITKFDSHIQICNRNDPLVEKCVENSLPRLKTRLTEGIPELGTPALDPLSFHEISIRDRSLNLTFNDIKVYNLMRYKVTRFDFDMDANKLHLEMFVPKIRATSSFAIASKLPFMELNGTGTSESKFFNVTIDASLGGNRSSRRGKEYVNFDKARVKLDVARSSLVLKGLLPTKELQDSSNRIIDNSIKQFTDALMPLVEGMIEEFVLKIVKNLFLAVPFDVFLT